MVQRRKLIEKEWKRYRREKKKERKRKMGRERDKERMEGIKNK